MVFIEQYHSGEEKKHTEEWGRLEQIVRNYTEKEYNHMIAQEKNWAILYALTHIRQNICEWLPIRKTDKVLEIGAGCGALTGLFADRAASVTATEISLQQCEIIQERYKDKENITLYAGRYSDVEQHLSEQYDWIFVLDSFETAGEQMNPLSVGERERPHRALLDSLHSHLAKGGRVVLTSANRLGLKYFAGNKEEVTGDYFTGMEGYEEQAIKKTFSRPELLQLVKSCGYQDCECFYPYPDAKLPMSVYSDRYLPKVGELWDNKRNFKDERYVLFDETKAFDAVIKDGLFPVFSNAFLLILSEEKTDISKEETKIIFTKYSNERGRSFAIRTDILEKEDGTRLARKTACYPEGKQHVENLPKWERELEQIYEGSQITLNHCRKSDVGVEMEYLLGETLEEKLDHLLLKGQKEEAVELFLQYIDTVREAGTRKRFKKTVEFEKVFGEVMLPPDLYCSEVTDIDMVAGNVIVTPDGWIHMDYEWTFDFPVPVNYVIYRMIHNYLYGNVKRTLMEKEWLYKRVGLSELEISQYAKMEEAFQRYITQNHIPLRVMYEQITPGCISFAAEEENRKEQARKNAAANTGIDIFVDRFEVAMTGIYLSGWAVSKSGKKVDFRLFDEQNCELPLLEAQKLYRKDVADNFKLSGENRYAGFYLHFGTLDQKTSGCRKFILQGSDTMTEVPFEIPVGKLRLKQSKIGQKIMELRGAKDVIQYIAPKDMGLFTESEKYRVENQRFDTWRMAHRLSEKELKKQRESRFAVKPEFRLVVLGTQQTKASQRTMESIKRQTYHKYKAVLQIPEVFQLEELADYTMFLLPGDTLTANALYEFVKRINKESDAGMIYCDSDKLDWKEKEYFDPQFKPDYGEVTLQSGNYIGNSVCFSKQVLEKVKQWNPEYENQAIYDLILRAKENCTKVLHIDKLLYHQAAFRVRDFEQRQMLERDWELGKRVLEDYYERKKISATVQWGKEPLCYQVTWKVTGEPLISVIIPNQDHISDLQQCLESITEKTTYENYEILVVENNSRQRETFEYYKIMQRRYPKVSLLTWEREFNYSAINNFAVRNAKGDYLIFLNNDTEILTRDWMEELLSTCQQKSVAVVGSRLYYPDGTIQHAGVILGLGEIAGHLFVKEPGTISGYMGKVIRKQNLSAVTAACMMSSREVFERIGGFDEELQVALNDVDYCLRCQSQGYSVVYDPDVELYHYESKSRGLDTTPEKKARYDSEVERFTDRWGTLLKQGDPYYNVNLSRTTWDCTFRIPRRTESFLWIE